MIFVFGSNLGGYHGKGAALTALKHHGAVMGQSEGLMGWSSYALPTCTWSFKPLPLDRIQIHVDEYLRFAREHPELQFKTTRVGCGLGKQKDSDIAPMFIGAPDNCFFDELWKPYLGETHEYWGSY